MRTVTFPVGDQDRFGAGVQYAYSEKISLNMIYRFGIEQA
jgi:hypothetical protein